MSNTWYTHAHTQPGTHAHNPYHLLYLPSSCCQDSWQPCDCEGVVLPASCHYNRWSGVDSTASTSNNHLAHTHVCTDQHPNGLLQPLLHPPTPISLTDPGIDHLFNKCTHMCAGRHLLTHTYTCAYKYT